MGLRTLRILVRLVMQLPDEDYVFEIGSKRYGPGFMDDRRVTFGGLFGFGCGEMAYIYGPQYDQRVRIVVEKASTSDQGMEIKLNRGMRLR